MLKQIFNHLPINGSTPLQKKPTFTEVSFVDMPSFDLQNVLQ